VKIKKYKIVLFVLFTCCGATVLAQSSPIDPGIVSFFDHLLLRIANLDDKPSELQRRQAAISRILSLSPQEQSALSAAVAVYQQGLTPLQQQVRLLTASNSGLSADNQSSFAHIASERESLVQAVTAQFVNALSPAGLARIQHASQLMPAPHK
jgi:hypothetical protein